MVSYNLDIELVDSEETSIVPAVIKDSEMVVKGDSGKVENVGDKFDIVIPDGSGGELTIRMPTAGMLKILRSLSEK